MPARVTNNASASGLFGSMPTSRAAASRARRTAVFSSSEGGSMRMSALLGRGTVRERCGGLRADLHSARSQALLADRGLSGAARCSTEQRVDRGLGDHHATAERERRDVTPSDAFVRAGSGDAEQLGNLGNGVGKT